jgi:histidine ammonia-lyase
MLMSINQHTQIKLSASAWKRVGASRKVVDDIVNNGQVKYGINTGFGNFAEVVISPDRLRELQENLIRSHAAGVGEPLTLERTKRLLCLRINVLAKGTIYILIEAYPERKTSSGGCATSLLFLDKFVRWARSCLCVFVHVSVVIACLKQWK